MRTYFDQTFGDFKCIHCRQHVSTDSILSGVQNRNHCPYCLHSKHLDLFESGDRLAACKGKMEPAGLTLKKTKKKYGKDKGELMLIHICVECGKASINRIAADDIADHIFSIYEVSLHMDQATRLILKQNGIQALEADDVDVVEARLYGWKTHPASEPVFA